KFSPVLRWLVLVLLVFTLSWKVATNSHESNESGKNETDAQRKTYEFLVRHQFAALVSEKTATDLPMIRASAGLCRMLVIEPSYDGSDRDRISGAVSATDTVFVVFGGRIYAEQPILLTVLDRLWVTFRRQLGLRADAKPVLVVIAKKGCEPERLPWQELG